MARFEGLGRHRRIVGAGVGRENPLDYCLREFGDAMERSGIHVVPPIPEKAAAHTIQK
jgi:hypothetical protein